MRRMPGPGLEPLEGSQSWSPAEGFGRTGTAAAGHALGLSLGLRLLPTAEGAGRTTIPLTAANAVDASAQQPVLSVSGSG